MKRHLALLLLRGVLAVVILYALPEVYMRWGEPYPGGGPKGFGLVLFLGLFSAAAALAYFLIGAVVQFCLRRRPPGWTAMTDLGLFAIISGYLVVAGLSIHYRQTGEPPHARAEINSGRWDRGDTS
jgi:hypothetical protein